MLRLTFDRGTVLIADETEDGSGRAVVEGLQGPRFDDRVGLWRAPACLYRDIVTALHRSEIPFTDDARAFEVLELEPLVQREPFPHQLEAVDTWWKTGRQGVVVLPTGSGKTYVAELALARTARSTLVVTPTIDLMQQWYGVLSTHFDTEVGLLGGGYHEIRPVTVSTFDSAWMHMERYGGRFGLLVFDECHHLPGASYSLAAEASLAPFRLGLTATPEREDGRHDLYPHLIGPIVYRREIKELAGEYLADYETVQLCVHLSAEEREEYTRERETYRNFVTENRIRFGSPGGWARFLMLTSQSESGRRAFLAYRTQKRIAEASGGKLRLLQQLFARHHQERVLVFTADNETVYEISRRFLVPAITHQTKVKERREILLRFNEGTYPFLVTSKVLNEGVDVPAASVGIILSGSGSVREHVQRLGRILRRQEGKRAVLYEVVAEDTAEEYVSSRRRKHDAYV